MNFAKMPQKSNDNFDIRSRGGTMFSNYKGLGCLFLLLTIINSGLKTSELYGQILWTGEVSVPPGHSSTYLPFQKGEMVNTLIQRDPINDWSKALTKLNRRDLVEHIPMCLKVMPELTKSTSISLWKRFENVWGQMQGDDKSQFSEFMNYYCFDPAEDEWRGLCHQFTAANNDPKIEHFIKNKNGLICGGDYFLDVDLKEIFTATYPSRSLNFKGNARNLPNEHYNDWFFYQQGKEIIERHGGETRFKELNNIDFEILDELGFINLPEMDDQESELETRYQVSPVQFVNWAQEKLNQGQRPGINIDPGGEIWNQPLISLKNEVVPLDDGPTYFSYSADDALASGLGNHFFFESSTQKGTELLNQMNDIDEILRVIVLNRLKLPDQPISLLKGVKETGKIELLKLIGDLEIKGKSPVEVIQELIKLKEEKFQTGVLSEGIKLKDKFKMEKYRAQISFMEEHDDFRADIDDEIVHKELFYLVVKNLENGFIYDKWLGKNVYGERIGFIWEVIQQSELARQRVQGADFKNQLREAVEGKKYLELPNLYELPLEEKLAEKSKNAFARNVCLDEIFVGVLDVCENCLTLPEAMDKILAVKEKYKNYQGDKSVILEEVKALREKYHLPVGPEEFLEFLK
jgi:hypothetical protein